MWCKEGISGPGVTSQQVRKDFFKHWYLFPVAVNHLCGKGNVIRCHELCLKMHINAYLWLKACSVISISSKWNLNDDIREEKKSAWTWFPALAYLDKKWIANRRIWGWCFRMARGQKMWKKKKPKQKQQNQSQTKTQTLQYSSQMAAILLTSRKITPTGNMSLHQKEKKPSCPPSLPSSDPEFQGVPSYLTA